MENQEQIRDWIYLLPGGLSAENMKEGCQIMANELGHRFGSHSFRLLVKNGVVKQIRKNNLPISAISDGRNKSISGI